MKTCPKCGKQFSDGVKQCPFDRVALVGGGASSAEQTSPQTASVSVSSGAVPRPATGGPSKQGPSASQPPRPVSVPPAPGRCPPNKRVCAALIDSFIGGLIGAPFSLLGPTIGGFIRPLIASGWWLARDVLGGGRSPGKKMIGLELKGEDGGQPSPLKLVMRNIPLCIPAINTIAAILGLLVFLYEYQMATTDADGRRFGDKMAGTRIRDENPQRSDVVYAFASVLLLVVMTFTYRMLPGANVDTRVLNGEVQSSAVLQQIQKTMIAEFDGKLPQRVDENTRLDTVTSEGDNGVTFSYTIMKIDPKKVDKAKFQKAMRDKLVEVARTNKGVSDILKAGIVFRAKYHDESGKEICEVKNTKDDL